LSARVNIARKVAATWRQIVNIVSAICKIDYEKMRREKRKGSEREEKWRKELSPMTVAIRWTNVDPRKSGRFQLKAGVEKEMRGKVERECISFLF